MAPDSDFDPFFAPTADHVRREKERARELRGSAWWKRKRSSGVCHYCHRRFKPAELTMDHVIPLSRGGSSTKENIVPCCKECNNRKRYLMPAEFSHYLEQLKQSAEGSGEAPAGPAPESQD